jgi:hypothetical protein
MLQNFVIFPFDDEFNEIRLISAKGEYMPYVALPENDKDQSSTWGKDSYVMASDKDFGNK